MKKIQKQIIGLNLLLSSFLIAGCASSSVGKSATVIGTSTVGAVIAHEASDGNLGVTAGGAAVGALAGIGLNAYSDRKEQKAYREGYEAALNQSVKQQYWITQNRQKEADFSSDLEAETFVPIRVPEQEINGEIRNERIIYLKAK